MKKQKVHLFVFDSLSDWEIGFAVAGINSPQFKKNPDSHCIRTVALRESPVVTMGGLRVIPDITLDMLSPTNSAMFILPGGIAWDEGKNMESVEVAQQFIGLDIPVAAICGATAGLARGGLLDHRRHTSNSREYLSATKYGGSTFYEDAPAVTDGNLITASGIAPLDFAFHIFRCLDLYLMPVLDAWYNLYKTGQPEYIDALMKASVA